MHLNSPRRNKPPHWFFLARGWIRWPPRGIIIPPREISRPCGGYLDLWEILIFLSEIIIISASNILKIHLCRLFITWLAGGYSCYLQAAKMCRNFLTHRGILNLREDFYISGRDKVTTARCRYSSGRNNYTSRRIIWSMGDIKMARRYYNHIGE